jgi:phosphomannomutase
VWRRKDTDKKAGFIGLEVSDCDEAHARCGVGNSIPRGLHLMKKLIVFDLDGTLAPSKSAIDYGMARLLDQLLKVGKVAVISGGGWPQFEKQVLDHLTDGDCLRNLSLLPTCGTKFFQYDNTWKELYSEDFTSSERTTIMAALKKAVDQAGNKPAKVWGEIIEDRGSQITFSALGQQAPLEAKSKWDPVFTKRELILAILTPSLPGFSVHMGGSTSIDITKPGIDKGYGIGKLRDTLGIAIEDMIFVGDALFPGGNDYPARQAGVYSIRVNGPAETKKVIEAIVGCLGQMPQPDSSETSI